MKLQSVDKRVTKHVKRAYSYIIDWDAPTLSKFQDSVKQFLRPYFQHCPCYEEFPVAGTRLKFDFFILYNGQKIAVEAQGDQHTKFNKHFHGGDRTKFIKQLKRDNTKLEFCEKFGIIFVEIYPKDELSLDLLRDQGVII